MDKVWILFTQYLHSEEDVAGVYSSDKVAVSVGEYLANMTYEVDGYRIEGIELNKIPIYDGGSHDLSNEIERLEARVNALKSIQKLLES